MMTKKKKKKSKRALAPDEQYTAGPLQFERYGRLTVARSSLDSDQHSELMSRLAASFPDAESKVENLVAAIAARVRRLPPDRLLHRAWWEFAAISIGAKDEPADDRTQSSAMRMIDYIQSVISSIEPVLPYSGEVSEDEWAALHADVMSLFTTLTTHYQLARHAVKRQEPDYNEALINFQFRTEILWINVRGNRYQAHECAALRDVLLPHSDVLQKLFGISADILVLELEKILVRLTRGLADMFVGMKEYHAEAMVRMDALIATEQYSDMESIRKEMFKDTDFEARAIEYGNLMAGIDFFNVEKIAALPTSLLEVLTWSPGEDREFFSQGEYCGWPMRIWPTMKRPFIRLNGKVCCFDLFSLFDNIYRVLQRAIFRLDPDYKATWNTRQQSVSEQLPFRMLQEILPDATVHQPVYYRWKVDQGAAQWYEADGLLVYDDHLFVVEVKAGAFTYTSPSTDLAAHLSSLTNLVTSPASQGSRFLDYLESENEVSIFNSAHQEIGKIRKNDYRHATICAITLDPFTHLAARAQHLGDIGIDLGSRNVWVLSIDDLRVYQDFFHNPLSFLHFVEQRMLAAQSKLVDLHDELDHIGLYLKQNNYSQHAREIVGDGTAHLTFDGFRTPIDEYYSARAREDQVVVPSQESPARIVQIIDFLADGKKPHRSEIASFFLDLSGDFRKEIAVAIDRALPPEKRYGILSTYGDVKLTLIVSTPENIRDENDAMSHTRSVMTVHDEASRFLVELEYSNDGVLVDIHWRTVDMSGLNERELSALQNNAEIVRKKRVVKARAQGKIGVNDKCPCGSDKKYKRCCMSQPNSSLSWRSEDASCPDKFSM